MWIYIKNTDNLECITVGFYDPNGKFQPESNHTSIENAASRVHYLNGGNSKEESNDFYQDLMLSDIM